MNQNEGQVNGGVSTSELPFILRFLEERPGAMSFTTTGTYNWPDGSDNT